MTYTNTSPTNPKTKNQRKLLSLLKNILLKKVLPLKKLKNNNKVKNWTKKLWLKKN